MLRIANDEDIALRESNIAKQKEAHRIASEKIRQHGLDMKLVDVEYTFNGSRITFFFTAEGRVDFRELVKDLAFLFKTRIELRQIGVRDEAKMLGGLGFCGRPVCCNTFLEEFHPVSIKMAKEQNLSLSPAKISGLCGRLMCCLKYEQAAYADIPKRMPRVGKPVFSPDGPGVVLDNNAITEKTKVRVTLVDGTYAAREYHYSLLRRPEEGEVFTYPNGEVATAEHTQRSPRNPQSGSRDGAPQRRKPNPRGAKQEESSPQQKPAQGEQRPEQPRNDSQGENRKNRPRRNNWGKKRSPQSGNNADKPSNANTNSANTEKSE